MRTWGPSGAAAAIRRAQAVSGLARQAGCGLDEAEELVARPMTRRGVPRRRGRRRPRRARRGGASAVYRRRGRGSPRVVIVGSGIAGLGCAYRLWARHGIRAEVYEYNTVPGGRIRTLRGHFDDGQLVEEHAEFINPEHTATLALAKRFGLRLDNTDKYRPGTHPGRETMRFHGKQWPQAALNRDWHDWGWKLFHHAANVTAPWPQLHNASNPGGRRVDHMSVTEWVDTHIPGGVEVRLRRGVHRGRRWTSSAARPRRCQRSTLYTCSAWTRAPPAAPSRTVRRNWRARTRSGISTAATTS